MSHSHADAAPIELHRGDAAVTRRRALQLMAASTALAGGACSAPPNERIHPWVHMPEAGTGGLPTHYASAVLRDGHAHGVLVGTKEGRPVKIEGNPLHPSSLGASDAFTQAAVLQLWDPDRSKTVRQRLGRPRDGAPPQTAASSWQAFETAWRRQAARLGPLAGARLCVLTGPLTSPTERALLDALLRRHPGARWFVHAPLRDAAAARGSRLAFGRELAVLPRLDRARCVLALAADPFSDGPGAVRQAMDWAAARAAGRDAGALPRALAAEVAPGLFGARADRRIALAPARIEALLARVAARWLPQAGAGATPAADAAEAAFEHDAVEALRAAGADALPLAGRGLSPAAHATALALGQRLGALGRTFDLVEPPDAAPQAGSLAELVRALDAGEVGALVVLGANPAYEAPGALGAAAALGRAALSVHAGPYADETAALCDWHLPLAHEQERWGDALAHDGSATLIQPAIAPIHDSRSPAEVLALLAADGVRDGHALVRRHWRGGTPRGAPPAGIDDAGFEAFWEASLRRGVVAASAFEPVVPPAAAALPPFAAGRRAAAERLPAIPAAVGGPGGAAAFPAPADGAGTASGAVSAPAAVTAATPAPDAAAGRAPSGAAARDAAAPAGTAAAVALTAVFLPDPSVHDGRYANLGWLQELPQPFTKLTWDNALQIGPLTARRLGLATGDVVRASAGGRAVDAPVWVLARHAEDAVSFTLGQGRRLAGRVGDGVGYDAFVLRPADEGNAVVVLRPTGARHAFAVTQHEFDAHGRDPVRVVAPGGSADEPGLGRGPSLYPDPAPRRNGHAWAMTIDLDACIGCNACTVACQAENNIPVVGREQVAAGREMHWIRVDRYDAPDGDAALFQPVPCMHCEKAPCELVCPVGATVHDSDGLNVQVYNRCVGTRFCSNNCPYKVRRFNFLQYADETTETLKAQRNPDVTVRQRGVMEKCTYCLQRIARARQHAETSGTPTADGDVVTACQSACPTRAIRFGDLDDPASEVARSRASPRHYALLGELGTRPRTTYLARVDATRPRRGGG